MRIVGGTWRGRAIRAPKGDSTRPTTDRVREALFSALTARLGADLGGGPVLDAFAGSGALGLEALSRGATHVTFVEKHPDATSTLKRNLEDLSATDRSRVLAGDVFALADRGFAGRFALILLDPPYTLDAVRIESLLASLAERGSVACGAYVTWEHAAGYGPRWPEGFCFEARKKYGSTEIDIAIYEGGTQDQ